MLFPLFSVSFGAISSDVGVHIAEGPTLATCT